MNIFNVILPNTCIRNKRRKNSNNSTGENDDDCNILLLLLLLLSLLLLLLLLVLVIYCFNLLTCCRLGDNLVREIEKAITRLYFRERCTYASSLLSESLQQAINFTSASH